MVSLADSMLRIGRRSGGSRLFDGLLLGGTRSADVRTVRDCQGQLFNVVLYRGVLEDKARQL